MIVHYMSCTNLGKMLVGPNNPPPPGTYQSNLDLQKKSNDRHETHPGKILITLFSS